MKLTVLRSPSTLAILALVTIVSVLALSRINRQVRFYDEAVYLVTAKALASGQGYLQESLPGSPPQGLYPPVLPLSLGFLWYFVSEFPQNLIIMRFVMLMAGGLFLTISYWHLREFFGFNTGEAICIVALVGSNEFFLNYAVTLSSEIPLALLGSATLYLYSRFVSQQKMRDFAFVLAYIGLAVLTRTIGLALFGAVFLHLLLMRKIRLSLVVAGCAAAVFLPWQAWSWYAKDAYSGYPPEVAVNYRGYVANLMLTDWLSQAHHYIPVNLLHLVLNWVRFILPWLPGKIVFVALLVVPIVGLYSLARSLLKGASLHDLYCVLYLIAVVIWPWPENGRFVLVLSPILIAYFFVGLKLLARKLATNSSHEKTLQTVSNLIAAIIISGTLGYNLAVSQNHWKLNPIYSEFYGTLDWIKQNTPANAILVGDFDPAYYLFTGRKSILVSYPDPFVIWYNRNTPKEGSQSEKLLLSLRQMEACYIFDGSVNPSKDIRLYVGNLIATLKRSASNSLLPVYFSTTGQFVIYEIIGCRQIS